MAGPSDLEARRGPGADHLARRLEIVNDRVLRAVSARRQGDPAPDDPFRGLYLNDETVGWLVARHGGLSLDGQDERAELDAVEAEADAAEAAGHRVTLRQLARAFDLAAVDVELLLVAMLPEVDARFESLIGYLNDDVTRRRPAVGLALELCHLPVASGPARARLAPASPLVSGGLLVVEDPDRPFLGRSLRVPDRVVSHLLGDDTPETAVAELLSQRPTAVDLPGTARLASAIADGQRMVCVRDVLGGPGRAFGAAALSGAGFGILPIDFAQLGRAPDVPGTLGRVVREARLTGAGIIAEVGTGDDPTTLLLLRGLADASVPVVLVMRSHWDSSWSTRMPLLVDAPAFLAGQRAALWGTELGSWDDARLAATTPFVLSPDGVARAAESARRQADFEDADVQAEHLRRGARLQNAAGLERLARRIEPAVGWDDLVLPPLVLNQLQEIALRARHREQVLGEWRMRPGGGRGRGVTTLFAGDSGTGKTMSAEVIAADLGLDLYSVDLATVVDKYVGETEKNLERIFSEAAGVNGVLLFDEADAVFGKRSEVKDAHDRYANIESAYLLQRMESFDGLAILATNLRANLDEAFTRRLDLVVDFPNPEVAQRRALWDRCLGQVLPRDADLDLDFCAEAFDVTGGSIRSIAVTAAYLAADSDQRITMTAPDGRRSAGVPQAGAAGAALGVRAVPGHVHRVNVGAGARAVRSGRIGCRCLFGHSRLPQRVPCARRWRPRASAILKAWSACARRPTP